MTSTSTSPDPEPEEEAHSVKIVSIVTHHTLVAGNVASTGAKSRVAKPSTAKAKKTEALDIENLEEYKAFAKEIKTVSPTKVTIFVDMVEIQKHWSRRGGRDGSDNEDVHGDNPGLYNSNGMTDLERSLARFRGILEKRYQNDHNAGYTYINLKTATLYPLTPQMMKEWAHTMLTVTSMMAKQTETIHQPTWGSVVANGPCSVALHPAHITAGVNVAAPPNISDIGHMATIISSLMGGPALLSHQALQTPPRVGTQPAIASLVIPTLTKLTRFLHHATVNLGIPAAHILHVVQDQDLVDLAMTKGDVICLKAGAQDWWKGPEARKKRGHAEMENSVGSGSGSNKPGHPNSQHLDTTLPSKKMAFIL
ncbi:hypothetical protein B0H14DRAFT_2632620 [Mycena olivaceomarginata]|nr:hypothetical protein B0H14DRAFT_2632620 [Mycena olivaceomarginata]